MQGRADRLMRWHLHFFKLPFHIGSYELSLEKSPSPLNESQLARLSSNVSRIGLKSAAPSSFPLLATAAADSSKRSRQGGRALTPVTVVYWIDGIAAATNYLANPPSIATRAY